MIHYAVLYFHSSYLGVGSTYALQLCTEKFKENDEDKLIKDWNKIDCPLCLAFDKEIIKIKDSEEKERYNLFIKNMHLVDNIKKGE
jgi:hypothetical protein